MLFSAQAAASVSATTVSTCSDDEHATATATARALSAHQLPVRNPMRPVCIRSLPLFEILGVVAIRSLEPDRLRVALERENVSGDPVEEPAVVSDHHRAAGEVN